MKTFKALQVESDKPGSAKLVDLPKSELAAGNVLIEVHYSSVNYKDALAVTGKGKILRRFPLIAGIDVSGVILESSNTRYQSGDEVLVTGCGIGEDSNGGYTELLEVSADSVVAVPNGLSLYDVMALGTAGFTAGLAIQRMQDNGQSPALGSILVTGATGGVASFAINGLSQLGFNVTALTSKITQSDYLHSLGAQKILDRQCLEIGLQPLEKSLWGGAIDTVGGEILGWITRTTTRHGNIAACGLAAGIELHTTVMPFILRGINLLGIHSVACPMPLRQKIWQRLATDLRPGQLDKIVTEIIGLQDILPVAEKMLAGKTQGRYVVKIRNS